MSKTTREQLLDAARRQFANKGYYGASIAGIAQELGLSKQALLHHFGSKEKLYGEILKGISDRMLSAIIRIRSDVQDPRAQLEALMLGNLDIQAAQREEAQILMREVLDNRARAEQAGTWYLKPFLDALVDIVRQTPTGRGLGQAEALALVIQLLGAISYFAVSEPTLKRMFGESAYAEMTSHYPEQLRALIRARLGGVSSAPFAGTQTA